MATATWKDSLQLGISSIDFQHKQLINTFDLLSERMKQGLTSDSLQATISELKMYTKSHFSKEEEYMEQAHYPNLAQHKQAHQYFIKRVEEFEKSCKSGSMLVSIDLIAFLKDWFLNHIRHTDNEYVPYLHKSGINK